MGYTHYHIRNKKNLGSAYYFGKLALDAKTIIAKAETLGISIRGRDGTGEPEFTEGYFSLNGNAELEQDYETFSWEALPTQQEWEAKRGGNDIFDFCKTQYRPYDAVVTAILIRAKVIYGSCVDVRSDGSWSEWQAGRDLYESVFGEEAPNPFLEVSV